MAQQNQLNQLASIAHAANHLLNIQLINEQVPPNNTGYVSPKFQYWCFVSFVPGSSNNDARSYDFQNSITQKFALSEIAGLAFTLQEFAKNNGPNVSPYSKFSRSQSGQKSLNVWQSIKENNNLKLRSINITVTSGQTKLSVGLSPEQAYGFASNLMNLYNRGINLELDRQLTSPRVGNQKPSNNQNSQEQNTGFIQNNPNDNINSQFSQMADKAIENIDDKDIPF